MSKTKLPSEFTMSPPSWTAMPCTQCGCPPTTMSAPASSNAEPTTRCAGHGLVRVLVAPVGEHDDDVDALVEPPDDRLRTLQVTAVEWSGAGRHPDLGRAGSAGQGTRGLADGVERDEAEAARRRSPPPAAATPTPSVGPAPTRSMPRRVEPLEGLAQRALAVVAGVVVRQRQHVEAGALQAASTRGSASKESSPCCGGPASESVLSRLPTVRSASRQALAQRAEALRRVAAAWQPRPDGPA